MRFRYIIALAVIAVLVSGTHLLIGQIAHSQHRNGQVIGIAASQAGITSRIAHFASLMLNAPTEDDYIEARAQLGRSINLMKKNHATLTSGDAGKGIPLLWSDTLAEIYFDQSIGLDAAIRRYLGRASSVYEMPYGTMHPNSGSFLFVTSYGPYALNPMFEAVVTEYEHIHADQIERITRMEIWLWVATLLALVFEAIFIFRPLETRVREKIDIITHNGRQLAESLRKAEDSKAQAQIERDRAIAADHAKAQFMSNMSHEFRTPLNAILGFSEALKLGVYGDLGSTAQRDRIESIHHSAEHLLSLVNDLLDLGAAEAGKLSLRYESVAVADIVSNATKLIEDAARHRGVRLAVGPYNAEVEMYCDVRRATQVLLNILSNAVKYSDDGDLVRVDIETPVLGDVIIRVTDNGPGMSKSQIIEARQRYGRISTNADRSKQGTGLGLPLSGELMKLHNGELRIDSLPGKGTTVTLVFPGPPLAAEDEIIEGARDVLTR